MIGRWWQGTCGTAILTTILFPSEVHGWYALLVAIMAFGGAGLLWWAILSGPTRPQENWKRGER